MSEQELKPCPFCGERWSGSDHDAEYYELKHKKPCFFGDDLMLIKFSEMIGWNTRPTHPLEAQQGEDEELVKIIEKNADLFLGIKDGVAVISPSSLADIILAAGYIRPSKSASREIVWPEKEKCSCEKNAGTRRLCNGCIANEMLNACKQAVAEARTDGGMIPLDKDLMLQNSIEYHAYCGVILTGEQKIFLNGFMEYICKKYGHPDVRLLVEALEECEEFINELPLHNDDIDHGKASELISKINNAYKPNAGRQ